MISGGQGSYRFSGFTLETSGHRLMRGNEEIYLPPKTFETLLYLVHRHGSVVKKSELLDTLWADVFVTENALAQCITEVREALNDDAHQPRYVKTIPRVGYKFIAEVEEVGQATSGEESTQRAAKVLPELKSVQGVRQSKSSLRPRAIMVILFAGVAIILITLLTYYLRAEHVTTRHQIKSIAVLPFKPIDAAARDESLELGMADTLITTLTHVREITVA